MEIKPLPCPFCGAILIKAHGMKYWVHSPGIPCLLGRWTIHDESIEAWNRRPSSGGDALAPFEKLAEEMHAQAGKLYRGGNGSANEIRGLHHWADRLSAMVEEVRGTNK